MGLHGAGAAGDEGRAFQKPSRASAEDASCRGGRRLGRPRRIPTNICGVKTYRLQTGRCWAWVLVAPKPGDGGLSSWGSSSEANPIPWRALGFPQPACEARRPSAGRSKALVASSGTPSRRREGKGSKLC